MIYCTSRILLLLILILILPSDSDSDAAENEEAKNTAGGQIVFLACAGALDGVRVSHPTGTFFATRGT